MKKFFTLIAVTFMMGLLAQPESFAQVRRPGQTATQTTTRPTASKVRPGNKKPGANTKPSRPGASTSRPGTGVTRPGSTSRPSNLTPPARPNRLPSTLRPVPTRPSTWRPGSTRFASTIFGISFGSTLANSLNSLYATNYSVDGYGTNQVYLRNVVECSYTWTDATLIYQNGILVQSQLYESTIGYNTSRYYGVFNNLRSLYGKPATRTTDGRNMASTWWSADGQYISLEYTLLKSTNGYRYYTILTFGCQ